MKPENTKRYLTDKDRDAALKLLVCGLQVGEIAEIMHCSKSTINYIRQTHTACVNKDWSVLQKLDSVVKPTVDWALKITGTESEYMG